MTIPTWMESRFVSTLLAFVLGMAVTLVGSRIDSHGRMIRVETKIERIETDVALIATHLDRIHGWNLTSRHTFFRGSSMKLHEYAKSIDRPSKEVSAAAEQLQFDSSHPSSKLSEEEVQQLNQHFGISASSDSESETESDDEDLPELSAEDIAAVESLDEDVDLDSLTDEEFLLIPAGDESYVPTLADPAPAEPSALASAEDVELVIADDSAEPEATPALPELRGVFPPRLYKYAGRRGLTLEAVSEACVELGITNPHRHMLIQQCDIRRLDAYFFPDLVSE